MSRWSPDARHHAAALRRGAPPPEAALLLAALDRADTYAADTMAQMLSLGTGSPSASGGGALPGPGMRMLLLKPVGDLCNLACHYCYEAERLHSVPQSVMGVETLEAILDNVLPYVEPPFLIFAHGGEPMLSGRPFFEALVRLVRQHPHGDGVQLGVQTNGTLVDEDWAAFFREHAFHVGVSLDGPPEAHDAERVRISGRGTHAEVVRGIQVLQRAGIPVGIISVLTADHAERPGAAERLFKHFQDLGLDHYDVHPAFAPIPQSLGRNVSPQAYARFMAELFDVWVASGDAAVQIRSFEHFFQGMTGIKADACYRSGRCTSILGVDPSGEAMPCTRPFGAEYSFGDLSLDPLPVLQQREGFRRFAADEAVGRAQVRGCEWAGLCGHGSCPHERLRDGAQAVDGHHVYCTCSGDQAGGYPALFRHLQQRTESVLAEAVLPAMPLA